jgi:dTDP-4-dehydrorhamnose reductase
MDGKALFMKILLTGKNGQVGFELYKKLEKMYKVIVTGRDELDLSDFESIRHFIDKVKPDMIINTAAYTAVDKAESEPDIAYKINASAVGVICEKAKELNIPIIHFSTDYVFDGSAHESYKEIDKTNPLSVYGKTKCDAEELIRLYPKHIIIRTSWVFGIHGNNFLKTILKAIQEKNLLTVIDDQWGAPTSAKMLADVTFKVINDIKNNSKFKHYGTYHLATEGETTWYRYAKYIKEESIRLGLGSKVKYSKISPILTIDYPTKAKRPLNSRLCTQKIKKTFMLELPNWQDEVKKTLRELIH